MCLGLIWLCGFGVFGLAQVRRCGVLREPRDDVVFHVSGSFGSDFVILLPVFSFQ
jgi:hypothetical protein